MKAVAYCTNCSINWARLHSQDVEDERYEFCPLCKTDMHLVEGKDETSYLCNPINNEISAIKIE